MKRYTNPRLPYLTLLISHIKKLCLLAKTCWRVLTILLITTPFPGC